MSPEEQKAILDEAAAEYLKQSEVVSSLRKSKPASEELSNAETKLREFKRSVDQARKKLSELGINSVSDDSNGNHEKRTKFNQSGTEGLLRRRFFIAPSFEIYGGVAGLYDYGPPGCAVKSNILNFWKQHFIIEENMLELEASCLTPLNILKASGHVEKFHDLLVKDNVTEDCFRADHLLNDRLNQILDGEEGKALSEDERNEIIGLRERLDELSEKEMDFNLKKYNTKAPETGNALTDSYPFNLMFSTSIGPTSQLPAFLRPETAQGIFVNFKRLLEYVGGKLPFACAQIGLAFRNEISPRAGLLRVREFQQAEIEHFVNADDKSHPKFRSISDVEINMYGRNQQMVPPYKSLRCTVGDAVDKGIIANETLGYFIGRTSQFVEKIGMNMNHVRFRQHLEHEMAHYASDCWDLEVECSSGWIECAGLADRSAYDLGNHSEKSGIELNAREVYAQPKDVESLVCAPIKSALGKAFKRDAQGIMKEIENLEESKANELKNEMETNGFIKINGFEIKPDHLNFKMEKKRVTGRSFYPSVIEPSFGIGRILCCLWEHCYYVREGEDETDGSSVRAVLALPAGVAPVKCTVLPLSKNELFNDMLEQIRIGLSLKGLINRVDDSGQSIGRRYARSDELGTPFGITVDFDSLKDGSVTVRERDSTVQIRCSVEQAVDAIDGIVSDRMCWSDVDCMYSSN